MVMVVRVVFGRTLAARARVWCPPPAGARCSRVAHGNGLVGVGQRHGHQLKLGAFARHLRMTAF